ncbi:unnamed protein product [Clonostachys chloroleuca]|uniref:Uncharacterized protein n=1 Tax=Clonostachys chloroleuca TaxID=1926264 RepID=A0AA35PYT6_9HYPO|nr:unnamed protein product [Clonostachys chloroleuca]
MICPPLIHGPRRRPCNTTSMQVYWISSIILERKKGFLIVSLELLKGDATISNDTTVTWGSHGYYFAENGMW